MKKILLLFNLLAAASFTKGYCEKVDWSKIQHWCGEGDKKAALVVQFDTDAESENPGALIWGFRWSGSETVSGEDFIQTIAAATNDLIVLNQYTGPMGSTLNGIGFAKEAVSLLDHLEYDFEGASSDERISFGFFSPETFMGQTSAPGNDTPNLIAEAIENAKETHIITHPLNQRIYGYPAYDYDWWKLTGNQKGEYWNSGWYDGYWSYWVGRDELSDLSYSGMGMSSVSISDGDVQAWKYINFSKDDSGYAPDVASWLPLNYSHNLSINSSGDSSLDSAKILNWLGDGGNSVSLTVTWGDDLALDNLVSGVKFEGTATIEEVIKTALKYDPRFYSLAKSDGSFVAFGFDTNGDNSAAINLNGQVLKLNDGVANTEGEYLGATGSSQYDHWKVNNAEGNWVAFVNGKKAEMDTTISSGDEISLLYLPVEANEMSECAYHFYLHPATEQGIWMLEECVLNTENGKMAYFPMIANVLSDVSYLYGAGISAEVYEPDGVTTSNAYSAYVTNGAKGAMSCRISVSKPADILIRPYLNIRKDWGAGKAEVKRVYGGVDSKVSTIVAHPMTNISLEGIEDGGIIEIDNMGVAIIKPIYEPANADFIGYTPEFGDSEIATFYSSVNAVVAHSAGETQLTITDLQGNEYGKYTIRVKDVDPNNKPDDDFQDGLVFLNEEWFTHTSGSLNYVDSEGNIFYRAYGNQNNNMAFGATSQFGMTYADKYIIMSKQPWDSGDTRPLRSGGRVVVFDAKTFKHIGAIEDIGGDGRACVGVNPSKVYLGTTKGVRVMDLDNITVSDANIEGITVKGGSGQIGDMVKAGKYVFITNISTGLEIVDSETDKLVKSVPDTKIQTIAQSKDGRVWFASNGSGVNTLTPVDPVTLEIGQAVNVPGAITCSSSSWRHGNLMASAKENVLLWGKGTYNGNDGDLYRWNLDEVEDPSGLTPIFVRDTDFNKSYGYGYGSPAYDDRTDTYIFATTLGFGANALNNWYHFVNATTGEVKKTIKLSSYWWFPAMPIVPDKYAAEIELDDLILNVNGAPVVIDLNDRISDADNLDSNITLYLNDERMTLAENEDKVAEVTLEGRTLSVKPLKLGTHYFTLNAESNGKVTSKEIRVNVSTETGINNLNYDVNSQYTVFDASGIKVGTVTGSPEKVTEELDLTPGIYILCGSKGDNHKVIIK